jgi:hypothetical protein
MKYTCPICGYTELSWPPREDMICPCCGTHFGLDDDEASHDELRSRWIQAGAQWFSKYTPEPAGWNPYIQLRDNLGYQPSQDEVAKALAAHPVIDERLPIHT